MKLDLLFGPMFSGKTTELLRMLTVYTEVSKKALYVNHTNDNRNASDTFSSHSPHVRRKLESCLLTRAKVSTLEEVDTKMIEEADVIGIDEAQFFQDLQTVVQWVEKNKKHVIVVGLDGDAKRQEFGNMHTLIPFADSVTKLHAMCHKCASQSGNLVPAHFTNKLAKKATDSVVEVGAHDKYEALCRKCFLEANP